MPLEGPDADPMTPYQLPFPKDAQEEIVVPQAIAADERIWVPQAPNVSFRPLCRNRSQGYWMNLLRVRKSGVLSRHRHPAPVHGFVLKGRWRYLEHDWVAEEGGYVFEPPGETHTLVVPEDVTEMITYFQVNGVMIYVDPWGKTVGYEDVFTNSTCAGRTTRPSDSAPTTCTSSSADRPTRALPEGARALIGGSVHDRPPVAGSRSHCG